MPKSPGSFLQPPAIRDRVAVVVEMDDRIIRDADIPAVGSQTYKALAQGDRGLVANGYDSYVLSVLEPGGERGTVHAVFLDPSMPVTQQVYNYEIEDGGDVQWPRLTQNWIVPRASFTGTRMTAGITAPPALGRTWTRTSERCVRFQDRSMDGLFVLLQVVYEDISTQLIRQRVDADSGRVLTVLIQKVPAGTAGRPADGSGYFWEVEPLNDRWAIATRDAASGLIGVGRRQYQIHRPYPWPRVLKGFQIVNNVDLSKGYDYAMKSWDDECRIDVLEYWTAVPPSLQNPTVMGPTAIRWNGVVIPNVNIPECLHPLIRIEETETSGGSTRNRFRNYPATRFTDWPSAITIYPSVQPHPRGGYRVVRWTVYAPQGIIA